MHVCSDCCVSCNAGAYRGQDSTTDSYQLKHRTIINTYAISLLSVYLPLTPAINTTVVEYACTWISGCGALNAKCVGVRTYYKNCCFCLDKHIRIFARALVGWTLARGYLILVQSQ